MGAPMMATQHKGKKTMNTKLIDAVFEQLGADDRDEFRDTLRDVLQGGASAGFHGFIYYTETRAFYLEHRALILEQLREDADGVGAESVISLVASFNCAEDCTEDEIGQALYGSLDESDGAATISNCLAWYALESVAHHSDN